MTTDYLNKITNADCIEHLSKLDDNSIDLFLSDIPYGINLDSWDVLHKNTNSALLGESPAQIGKSGFKKRGKPINGWSSADKNAGKEYQQWCDTWTKALFPIMKEGSSLFVFGARRTIHRAINSFEDSGFMLKDILMWKKPNAHHRAQRVSGIFEKRRLFDEAKKWDGWRLGNLAPIYEPIAWFMKPYKHTLTDNILEFEQGAINVDELKKSFDFNGTNILEYGFSKDEYKFHEAQKPISIMEFLIQFTTIENQIILDPFMGSGTTAAACQNTKRKFIGFETDKDFWEKSEQRLKMNLESNYLL